MVKYNQWFGSDHLKHLGVSVPDHCMTNLLRFRLGSTSLYANDLHNIPREQRLCKLCGSCKVEDELHVVLECRFYDALRSQDRWSHLFGVTNVSLNSFMNQDDQFNVAHFITALLSVRKQGLIDSAQHNWDHFQTFSSSDSEYECGSQRGSHALLHRQRGNLPVLA